MYWSRDKIRNLKKGEEVIYINTKQSFIDDYNLRSDEGTLIFEYGYICTILQVVYSPVDNKEKGYKLYVGGMDNYLHYENIDSFMLLSDFRKEQIDSIIK